MKKVKPFANFMANTIGITRILFYRTFIYRNWSLQNPMFNFVEVGEGKEADFANFLAKAAVKSNKYKTPISFGPYKVPNKPIFTFVTHYYSVPAFLKVMNALLFSGLGFKRAKCPVFSNWTFCDPNLAASPVHQLEKIILVGIEGDSSSFEHFLNLQGINYHQKIQRIKTVRDTSLDTYIVIENTTKNNDIIEEYKKTAVTIQIYKAELLEQAERTVNVPALSK